MAGRLSRVRQHRFMQADGVLDIAPFAKKIAQQQLQLGQIAFALAGGLGNPPHRLIDRHWRLAIADLRAAAGGRAQRFPRKGPAQRHAQWQQCPLRQCIDHGVVVRALTGVAPRGFGAGPGAPSCRR